MAIRGSRKFLSNNDIVAVKDVTIDTPPYTDPTATQGSALVVSLEAGTIVSLSKPATGTVTSVNSAAASTTILAANANRAGATILNTDANTLRLLLADGVASASNYSVPVISNAVFEVPFGYTGIIKGIWDIDGAGQALVTEFS